MAASKRLVFIPEINDKTWLLMTNRVQGTCLRDYSTLTISEDRTYSLKELDVFLNNKGSYSERLPSFSKIPFNDKSFWKEQIEFRNRESGLSGETSITRLQEKFKREIENVFSRRNSAKAFRTLFERWIATFSCVKDKVQFNHWDNDCAVAKFSSATGIGWTSQLLEASRRNGSCKLVSTGNKMTDFSFAAMEVGFGISSKNNLFQDGQTDFIKPDGLGIREDGCFTVIEVKGPSDERDLLGPVLQAACGAAALVAKSRMICRIAKAGGKLRPPYSNAIIPKRQRSIGIHVLTAKHKKRGSLETWSLEIEQSCKMLLAAFVELKYIAFSFVEPDKTEGFTKIVVDKLIQPDTTL